MAVTARTRQLISEQQKTNRRRRAVGSLKEFSAMFLALKDRKRAIEKEEEALKLAQGEAARRERESDAKIRGDTEKRAIDRFRAQTAAGNLTNAEARLLLDQEKHNLDKETEDRLWLQFLHSVSEAGKPKVYAPSGDEKILKEFGSEIDAGVHNASMIAAFNQVSMEGGNPLHAEFPENFIRVAKETLFGNEGTTLPDGSIRLESEVSTGSVGDFPESKRPAALAAFVKAMVKRYEGQIPLETRNAILSMVSQEGGAFPLLIRPADEITSKPVGGRESRPSEFDQIFQGP